MIKSTLVPLTAPLAISLTFPLLFTGCFLTYNPAPSKIIESNIVNNIKYNIKNIQNIDCSDSKNYEIMKPRIDSLKQEIMKLEAFSENRDRVTYKSAKTMYEISSLAKPKSNSRMSTAYCEIKKSNLLRSVQELEKYIISKENYKETQK